MAAGKLPQDILMDILSRLPVKSLLRFRCIHKTWNSLLKSSYFVTNHLQNPRNKYRASIILPYSVPSDDDNNLCNLKLLALDTFHHRSSDHILPLEIIEHMSFDPNVDFGSCNGLVCIWAREIDEDEDDYDDDEYRIDNTKIVLYNPSLKQHKVLPESDICSNLRRPGNKNLVFGFGYDSTNNDYKVVREHWYCGTRTDPVLFSVRVLTEVFTLQTNSWRKVRPIPYYVGFTKGQCFFNGAIHRLARNQEFGNGTIFHLVSFDVRNEEFNLFSLPDVIEEPDDEKIRINEYRDLLCLFNFVSRGNQHCCDIWTMEEYGDENSWIQLHSITLCSPATNRFPWKVLGFGTNGELILKKFRRRRLVVYCLRRERFKLVVVSHQHQRNECLKFYGAVACLESLVSLGG